MNEQLRKWVIILIGPPGSGKGTQALWLEREKSFFHLESTAVIRKYFSENPDDQVVLEQKALIAKGELVDPPIILEWMRGAITELAGQGKSLTFSGSPRTVFEAMGDTEHEGEILLLARLYGPENIYLFNLQVSEDECVRRNLVRRVCVANGHPIPDLPEYRAINACPWDGSPLQRRPDKLDDDEKLIRERYQVYLRRTMPVMAAICEQGYACVEINGENSIEAIHHQIIEVIERRRMPVPQE